MNELIRQNRLLANIILTVVTSLIFQGGPLAETPRASLSKVNLSPASGFQINKGVVGQKVRNHLRKNCVGAKDSALTVVEAGFSGTQSGEEKIG
ncbi:MAG: hypothetical protein OEZ51_04240 [Nitrospinota bacterium]|nr:hypothetical protein [Nitrospinota bacterium]